MMTEASIRRVVGVAAIAAGLLGPSLAGASAASAKTAPPTLSGETLTGPQNLVTVLCTSTGSFAFTTSGTATGPYSGTFTESGSGTIGPGMTVTDFTATFTIDSATGEATGTSTFNSATSPSGC